MTKTCHYCHAKLWPTETSSLCCANGQVNLPPLQTLPEPLHQLFVGDTAESSCFQNNSRGYNSAFAFTSLGVNEDMLQAGGYCFRVSDTVCHRIGHLQPNTDGERPKFAQLYMYDTDNEIQNRLNWNQHLKPDVLHTISSVINGVNPFAQFYTYAANQIEQAGDQGNLLNLLIHGY